MLRSVACIGGNSLATMRLRLAGSRACRGEAWPGGWVRAVAGGAGGEARRHFAAQGDRTKAASSTIHPDRLRRLIETLKRPARADKGAPVAEEAGGGASAERASQRPREPAHKQDRRGAQQDGWQGHRGTGQGGGFGRPFLDAPTQGNPGPGAGPSRAGAAPRGAGFADSGARGGGAGAGPGAGGGRAKPVLGDVGVRSGARAGTAASRGGGIGGRGGASGPGAIAASRLGAPAVQHPPSMLQSQRPTPHLSAPQSDANDIFARLEQLRKQRLAAAGAPGAAAEGAQAGAEAGRQQPMTSLKERFAALYERIQSSRTEAGGSSVSDKLRSKRERLAQKSLQAFRRVQEDLKAARCATRSPLVPSRVGSRARARCCAAVSGSRRSWAARRSGRWW